MRLKSIKKRGIQFFLILTLVQVYSCSEDGMDGIDAINGNDGINGVDGANGQDGVSGGAGTLVLAGDITNEAAAAKIAERVGVDTQSIVIKNTTNLTSVEFPEITELIDVVIENNEQLTSVSIPSLETAVGQLSIVDNELLVQIELPSLESLNNLAIDDNPNFAAIRLPLLNEIRRFNILRNPSLTELSFPELTTVIGSLNSSSSVILGNNSLEIIDFSKLERYRRLIISDNNSLVSINLPALVSVGLRLEIQNNSLLESINLTSLTSIRELRITNNDLLNTIDFSSLEAINKFDFSSNTSIEMLSLPELVFVGDEFNIFENTNLLTIDFPKLTTVGDIMDSVEFSGSSIDIFNNDNLATIAIPVLATVEKSLIIRNNINLNTLDMGAELTVIGGNMQIEDSSFLKMLSFPKLAEAISIFISDNNQLEIVDFPALAKLQRNLRISRLGMLTNISLPAITDFETIQIVDTPLTDTNVNAILAQLESVTPILIGKTIELSGSASGQGVTDAETLRFNGNTVTLL